MIHYDPIIRRVEELRRKYAPRDPDALCGALGIRVVRHPTPLSVQDFKGLSMVVCRVPVIVLNAALPEELERVVLAHEIGHIVLHRSLTAIRGFHDFDLFGMKDRCEYEANVFAAELLLSDSEVLEALNGDVTFFGAARALAVPPELLDFKFRVLKHRGYAVTPPLLGTGDFLRRVGRDG